MVEPFSRSIVTTIYCPLLILRMTILFFFIYFMNSIKKTLLLAHQIKLKLEKRKLKPDP